MTHVPAAHAPSGEQHVGFVMTADRTRLAYAVHGQGYPLVRAAHWLTHVQHDWESPVWQPWLRDLGRRYRMVRYDERGCGLSDWDVEDFSVDAWVTDLEAVVDGARLNRFALLGMSQGAPVAISYAVRHPERVSHLIILGGYLQGWAKGEMSALERDEREASVTLMRIGWGRDNPSFRRLFTFDFVPDGDESVLRAYDELMRQTTSPANAARFEEAFGEVDVAELAPLVRVPTLVLHLDDDRVVPFEWGPRIASAIPGARFVQLHGRNHVLRPGEPAWGEFLRHLDDFVGTEQTVAPETVQHSADTLTRRQLEILGLVARGLTNQEIASTLGLSVRTVERHLSDVYVKLDLSGKAARAGAAARATELRMRGAAGDA
jgi:pimeloyl-ACP methyl ester carboxylesterase/DNA-binding CsgD family transcriptional regulator